MSEPDARPPRDPPPTEDQLLQLAAELPTAARPAIGAALLLRAWLDVAERELERLRRERLA